MGYRYPGDETKAAIELYPVTGKKSLAAAQQAGLASSSIPTLLIEGKNKPGLGYALAQAIAEAGVDLSFLIAQVIGRKYSAVIGFVNQTDAEKAKALIKKAVSKKK
jgi:predicted amino acid-binding ACT domain protein